MNKYEEALRRIKKNKYCEEMGHSTVGLIKKTNDFNLLLELCKHDKFCGNRYCPYCGQALDWSDEK